MAFTAPLAQAIKFLAEGETPFNDLDICGCDTQEQWKYTVTNGDTICFQLSSQCDLGDDIILNGSFEDGSDGNFTDSEWTRSVANVENTNVTRVINTEARCGNYIAYWQNEVSPAFSATITQTYAGGFSIGQLYILTFQLKAFAPVTTNGLADAFQVTVGGQVYYITPTTSWDTYTIYVTFSSAPSNNNIVFQLNTVSETDITELYLDCVEMKLVEGCCIKSHINNGDFELGEKLFEDIITVATADNWTLGNTASISDTLGYDGTRCAVLNANGDSITQENVFPASALIYVKFKAKASSTATLELSASPTPTLIDTFTITTDWQEFTAEFTNTTDTDILFSQNSTNETIYIDDVEVYTIPALQIEIRDLETESSIVVSTDVLSYTPDAIIACIPVNDIENLFECFEIYLIIEDCEQTLISEQFTYNPIIDSCLKELIWYDNTDYAMGIDYSTGYQNVIRVKAQLTNPQYEKIDYTKSLDGDVSNITAGKIRKTIELSLDALPEFIWDRISTMILVSNISYDGVSLCSGESTEINTQPDKNSRLISGTILLYPEGEFIAEKSINCS